ncbi:MAG TPA: hypothetical protein VK901_08630, partial [Nitrospiraceae bacterium]|nr:hypothetical protein [Nitrospiraceae bacterium]
SEAQRTEAYASPLRSLPPRWTDFEHPAYYSVTMTLGIITATCRSKQNFPQTAGRVIHLFAVA